MPSLRPPHLPQWMFRWPTIAPRFSTILNIPGYIPISQCFHPSVLLCPPPFEALLFRIVPSSDEANIPFNIAHFNRSYCRVCVRVMLPLLSQSVNPELFRLLHSDRNDTFRLTVCLHEQICIYFSVIMLVPVQVIVWIINGQINFPTNLRSCTNVYDNEFLCFVFCFISFRFVSFRFCSFLTISSIITIRIYGILDTEHTLTSLSGMARKYQCQQLLLSQTFPHLWLLRVGKMNWTLGK